MEISFSEVVELYSKLSKTQKAAVDIALRLLNITLPDPNDDKGKDDNQ
jgi:hypothetical protein